MLVALLVAGSIVGRPPQVHSALETLSTCQDLRAETCLFAAAWLKMGGDPAMPEVLKVAHGMTQAGQFLTISAIATMPSKAVTETLGKLAADARLDPMARALALDKLTHRASPPRAKKGPLDVAIMLADDADPTVRQAAVRFVANKVDAKNKKLIALIADKSSDEDGGVRSEAVVGFGLCDCAEAPARLEVAVKDQDARVRRAAVEALAIVKHPVVVPALVALMTSYDESMNRLVARALRFQSGESFGEDAEAWKRWLAQRN